ncbi:Origin recognition complex, subunit 1 [Bonamia ostreae]|uniref:Origin recognition complex subunit 1 n=1 Tax=Bonamia ostreae TaxID=126728 RepID=A0ABV2AEV8_9EUKA
MAKSKINRIAKKSSLAKLSASYKFGKLVCRESEIQKLDAILKNALSMKFSSGSGLCFFAVIMVRLDISGMPGTGKTTVVSYVINGLGKMATKGDLPNFLYINVNAMKLMSPSQIYMTILLYLNKTGKRCLGTN